MFRIMRTGVIYLLGVSALRVHPNVKQSIICITPPPPPPHSSFPTFFSSSFCRPCAAAARQRSAHTQPSRNHNVTMGQISNVSVFMGFYCRLEMLQSAIHIMVHFTCSEIIRAKRPLKLTSSCFPEEPYPRHSVYPPTRAAPPLSLSQVTGLLSTCSPVLNVSMARFFPVKHIQSQKLRDACG